MSAAFCVVCGKEIPEGRVACSIACRDIHHGRQLRLQAPPKKPVWCRQCHQPFTPSRVDQKTCSENCLKAFQLANLGRAKQSGKYRDAHRAGVKRGAVGRKVPPALGTAAATARNEAAPHLNHDARVWKVICPDGTVETVINLRRWMIRRLGEKEGERVYQLLRRMSAVMAEDKDAWVTRCGWSLLEASQTKPVPNDEA